MFQWADRYRPVAVPNYDQVGSLSYYVLCAIRCLSSFSVPAFLFFSGFFIAYSARGSESTLSWKVVSTRLRNLLIPYLIWSAVIFVGDALQGIFYTPGDYIRRLALGRAHPAYFYIPLICQFYVLSPWVVRVARTHPKWVLLGSALLQVTVLGSRYLIVFDVEVPTLNRITDLLFPMYGFFFAGGVVSGFHLQSLKIWLSRAKWYLLATAVLLGALALTESELVYGLTGIRRGAGPTTIPASLYAVALISCWLAFDQLAPWPSKGLYQLGRAVFGIYLLHPKVLEFVARAVQKFAPWLLAHQVFFQPTLVVAALGGPLLFMRLVGKSPARRFHRCLFG
jgi:membrane-bound acyltransferase YfiQ involved in biofilm formation